jgi:hypothetical protein
MFRLRIKRMQKAIVGRGSGTTNKKEKADTKQTWRDTHTQTDEHLDEGDGKFGGVSPINEN